MPTKQVWPRLAYIYVIISSTVLICLGLWARWGRARGIATVVLALTAIGIAALSISFAIWRRYEHAKTRRQKEENDLEVLDISDKYHLSTPH